jgi:acetyl esterase/lipase
VDVVAKRAREQEPSLGSGPERLHLAGCSMGGSVALEVVSRARGAFGALAVVQSAHGAHRNPEYASMLAVAGPKGGALPTMVLTSEGDPFRDRNQALARALAAASVPHELRVLPGPHDQPWLREAGSPEMLHWLDRRPR